MKKKRKLLRFCSFSTQRGCVFDQKLEETMLCITDVNEEVQKFKIKMLQLKQEKKKNLIPDQAADGQTIVSRKVQAATGFEVL